MYKKTVLSSAILAAMLAGTSAVADEQGLIEEIVVQGIRGSLSKALDNKRNSYQIIDSIVAEDIGKFPDNNVIEALQRITGVQTTGRGAGEVSGVSIRGLTDIHTTVNGRDVFTGSGRAVALQDIPASLLSNVVVYKTRSAEQVERGIAGSIDIVTHRPFDFADSRVVMAARGIYSDQPKKVDPNISVMASNRWSFDGAGEFGALINVSYARTNYRDDSITAGAVFPFFTDTPHPSYAPYQMIPNSHTDGTPIWQAGLENGLPSAPGSTLNIGGIETEYLLMRDAVFGASYTGERKRPAASLSLQWAPDDRLEFTGEVFYTGYRNSAQNAMWFTNVLEHENGNIDIPIVYEGTNVVKQHQGKNNFGFQSGDYSSGKTDSYLYALAADWKATDSLTINSELVYQTSKFETDFFAMRFERTAYGLDVDYNNRDGVPSIVFWDNPATPNIDESDMAAVANWNASGMWDNGGGNSGDSVSFKVDADLDVSGRFIDSVKAGIRYEIRNAEDFTRGQDAWPSSPRSVAQLMQDLVDAGASGDGSGLIFTVDNYFAGRANIFDSYIAANGAYLLANADAVRSVYGIDKESVYKTFDVQETSLAAYVTSNFSIGDYIRGEAGLRYVTYEQDMEFWSRITYGEYDYSTGKGETSKVLPSFVISWDVTNDLIARFSYTQTLRMPNFGDLNALQYWFDPVTSIPYGTGNGGNPNLKATESTNFDLSLEWYFAPNSSLYGAAFKRDIEGLVIAGRTTVVRTGDDGVTRPYVLSAPVNAADGELTGLEIGLVYFPDRLPDALDGLGIQASYTMLDSSQRTPEFATDGSISGYVDSKMTGVSDSSYSVVLIYDKGDFDARLSYVWREAFYTGNEAAIFANPIQFWSRPERSLDLQLSYRALDNLTVTFDATNLLDDVYQNHYGEGNQNLFNFGNAIFSKTYALGVRYSF